MARQDGDLIHIRCLRSSDLNRVAWQVLDAAQRERNTPVTPRDGHGAARTTDRLQSWALGQLEFAPGDKVMLPLLPDKGLARVHILCDAEGEG